MQENYFQTVKPSYHQSLW